MIKKLKQNFLNLSIKKKIIYLIVIFVTLIPTTFLGLLAFTYYYIGIESTFNNQISKSISKTVNVAKLYLEKSKESIKFDLLQIEKVLNKEMQLINNASELTSLLNKQVKTRGITEAAIFIIDEIHSGKIIGIEQTILAKSSLAFSMIFQKVSLPILKKIYENKVHLFETKDGDKIYAATKLEIPGYRDDMYLIISNYVDKKIIEHLKNTQGSAKQYYDLMHEVSITKHKLYIAFLILSFTIIAISLFVSIKFANIIIQPLNKLFDATHKIKEGNYSVRLYEREANDELSSLSKAFNKMTSTIQKQHNDLKFAYKKIDERVKFIEAVLTETASGVIATSTNKKINLFNHTASKLLSLKLNDNIETVFPEITNLIKEVQNNPHGSPSHTNIIIKRKGRKYNILITIGVVIIDEEITNIIISFEDITKLVAAQRESAWSDVARRIAHEIKNPLTPIQLSAEKLKTKYSNQISKNDLAKYQRYINSIIKNANDIHIIINEFIQFARIPKANLKSHDIVKITKDAIFNQKNIYKNINYIFNNKLKSYNVICDRTQITQVLTNLSNNAAESIKNKYGITTNLGLIRIEFLEKDTTTLEVSLYDNGSGIKENLLLKILEPYITTKKTGMGLGLSIVKKILDDHDTRLDIKNLEEGVLIKFYLKKDTDKN